MPCSLVGTRIFVNLSLLKEVTGSDEPPKTFGELVAIGPKTQAYAKKVGRDIRTMASCYKLDYFYGRYQVAFTASLEPALDTFLVVPYAFTTRPDGALTALQALRLSITSLLFCTIRPSTLSGWRVAMRNIPWVGVDSRSASSCCPIPSRYMITAASSAGVRCDRITQTRFGQ